MRWVAAALVIAAVAALAAIWPVPALSASLYRTDEQVEAAAQKHNPRLDWINCEGFGRESHEGSGRFKRFACVSHQRECTYSYNLRLTTKGNRVTRFVFWCES